MAIHSNILAGGSYGQRSLAGYSPYGIRVGHDRSDLACMRLLRCTDCRFIRRDVSCVHITSETLGFRPYHFD